MLKIGLLYYILLATNMRISQKFMERSDVDVNSKDMNGSSPAAWALEGPLHVREGRMRTVDFLLPGDSIK